MAPIVAPTSSSDELNFAAHGNGPALTKAKLDGDRHGTDDPLSLSDGRDDDVGGAARPEGGEPSNLLLGEVNNADDRQSKLFAEEVNNLSATRYLGNEDCIIQPIDTAAMPQSSLMQSSPPSPASPLGLEDVDIDSVTDTDTNAGTQSQVFDDFAVAIMSQIDADEALARQLQEEEDKKRMVAPNEKPRPKVVPSMIDSLLGEPSPYELRNGNYARVDKKETSPSTSSGSGGSGDLQDMVSSGISMMTNPFKRLGNSMTAAATDFFGEDISMQKRTSTSPITATATNFIFPHGSPSQYRNEV